MLRPTSPRPPRIAFLSSLPLPFTPAHSAPHHRIPSSSPRMCAATPALVDWLSASSASVHPGLLRGLPAAGPHPGLCLSAESPGVLRNAELASLPAPVFLSSQSARPPAAAALAPASWLAIQLLIERAQASASPFAPLLDVLPPPHRLHAAALWPPPQRAWLLGSPAHDRAKEIADGVRDEWQLVRESVAPDLFPDPDLHCSLDLYRWAIAVVDACSAAVAAGKELVLAPLAAQLAPARAPTVRVEAASKGMFFSAKKVVRIVAERELQPGEELTVRAGAPPRNADLLIERGVVLSDTVANAVEMVFSLTPMDRFYEDKVDILERYGPDAGIPSDGPASFELEAVEEGSSWHPPESLDTYLRLLCMGSGDAFLLEGVFRNEIWDHLSLPFSPENEQAICDTVIGACEDALEGYGLAEDAIYDGDAEDEAAATRWAFAKELVDAERGILKNAIKTYKRRASSLDAVEYYAERRLKALDLLRPVDESEIVDSESGARVGRAFDENYY